ncbi:acyltransferase [Nocardioides marinus]|uniref:Peptidoglycan/LPS O-acetylase OafA/YrhL n=1 Tax=Nocardioides marinus TaxID=374514 RepID=A0A7Y9YI22_9ACTN|nr:acyltransferase [Nocardioides marinus]NYI12104.1 peptidoglycan/LPS O-acetylase OafA/YrhL [Nocardioides marinus]
MTTTMDTPPTAPAPTSTPVRRYPLGWLRGVAALVVVVFHGYQHQRYGDTYQWPLTGTIHELFMSADLFVDLFFVLSGLVLWLPIAQAVVDGATTRPGRVLLYRRMARLLPLYLTVVLLVWSLTNPSAPGHWVDLLTHLTFTHVYSDTYIFWTNGPAWTLAIEFHFYVLVALSVPLLNRLVQRTGTRAGRVAVASALPVALVVVGAAYLVWATLLSGAAADNWSVWFSPLAKAADFGVGMLLAVVAATGVRLASAPRSALLVLGLGSTVALMLTRPVGTPIAEWWHPMYAVGLTVALAHVVLHDGPWARWMSWGPLVWLGGLGYGIYLIHEPVLRLLGSLGLYPEPGPGWAWLVVSAMVAVPSVLLAWVSARTVEAAGLRLLATMRPDGSPRDYYDHLDPRDPARRVESDGS